MRGFRTRGQHEASERYLSPSLLDALWTIKYTLEDYSMDQTGRNLTGGYGVCIITECVMNKSSMPDIVAFAKSTVPRG